MHSECIPLHPLPFFHIFIFVAKCSQAQSRLEAEPEGVVLIDVAVHPESMVRNGWISLCLVSQRPG